MSASRYTGGKTAASCAGQALYRRRSTSGRPICGFVRSPFGRARIIGIDTGAAKELPGVVAVVTGEDVDLEVPTVAFLDGQLTPRQLVLAHGTVRYCGEPVAALVGESRDVVADALELIDVEYDPLWPSLTPNMRSSPTLR